MKEIYEYLTKKYKTTDPFKISEKLGVIVLFQDLGETSGIHHTFTIEKNVYHCIHINDRLNYEQSYYTMAHELGHMILHEQNNINFLKKFTVFPISKLEFEADLFASYFIVSDEEFIEINNYLAISEIYGLDKRICEKRAEHIKNNLNKK